MRIILQQSENILSGEQIKQGIRGILPTHITDMRMQECVNSPYVKPKRICYHENGIKKTWDFIQSLDSVAIILHRIDIDALVVVVQFRPPVYVNGQNDGYTYELCAGLLDKHNKSIKEVAAEEVQEECGYTLSPTQLHSVAEFHTSVGTSGAKQHIFYASVTQDDKILQGGGVDGEIIQCLLIARADLETFLYNTSYAKTPGLGFGILWFLQHTTKKGLKQ